MLPHRLPNKSRVNQTRVRKLFESIRRDFQDRQINSHADLKQRIFDAMSTFFQHAGKSTLEYEKLDPDSPRFASLYNKIINTLADDFEVAYEETKALLESVLGTFNYQAVIVKSLDYAIQKATSSLHDLEIISFNLQEPAFIAGDDFVDSSRIDLSANLSNPLAELPSYQNAIVLKRTRTVNLAEENENLAITVNSEGDIGRGLYEGKMFALAGAAQPEADEFDWTVANNTSALEQLDPGLLERYRQYVLSAGGTTKADTPGEILTSMNDRGITSGTYYGITFDEWVTLGAVVETVEEVFAIPPRRSRLFATSWDEDTFLYDVGASPEKLAEARKTMVDGDPGTYWQIEFVQTLDDNAVIWEDVNTDDLPPTIEEGYLRQAEEIADRNLGFDFRLNITFDLGEIQQVNWLSLIPHVFVEGHWLEVTGIETSINGETWTLLEGWEEGKFENILTDEANAELTEEEKSVSMAMNKFEFTGRGLWTFPPREARFIRFKLNQPIPEANPYNVVRITMRKTTTTRKRKKTFGFITRSDPRENTEDWDVFLSYPESTLIFESGKTPKDFIEEESSRTSTFEQEISGINWGTRKRIGVKTEILDDSVLTRWDKVRYAIGIKEIGIHSHTYESASEMVSKEFQVPKPLDKVFLMVDEFIPKDFGAGDWIEYYTAFGDDEQWHQIRPLDHREPQGVPVIINVNSPIAENDRIPAEGYVDLKADVKKVRFRAILRRPSDSEQATPVLKSYRLKMLVK